MEPDKNNPPADENQPQDQSSQTPADALSRTPDDLEQEQSAQAAAAPATAASVVDPTAKKLSPIKKFFRKVNLYFLIFILLVVVAAAITVVNYLNSTKPAPTVDIATQGLTEDALKQLNNTDATVGGASQTLTIQGNAVISGQTLMRGNLNVAGNFQSGGSIQGPKLTISGETSLGSAQINSLQVATNTAIQGTTTLRDLSVAGTSSFSGNLTASQITTSRIVMSGNAILQIPNHLSFTGPSPSRTINAGVLGNGGSASVNGSDTNGTININTGANPSPGCFARINFQQAFTGAAPPHVIVSPVGAAAGQLQYYVDRNNSGFSICTNNAAAAHQAFGFDYFVTG
jgi:cytoskeletal protein CcmA (bactofilin family)